VLFWDTEPKQEDGRVVRDRPPRILDDPKLYFAGIQAPPGSRVQEGDALAAAAPGSTTGSPLPGDDTEAMETLCRNLHMRHDTVPTECGSASMLALARLCDKYDCCSVVKPTFRCWIALELSLLPYNEAVTTTLLEVACILRDPEMVSRVGVQLILTTVKPVKDLNIVEPHVPAALLGESRIRFPGSIILGEGKVTDVREQIPSSATAQRSS
jgi:hypothetical protein